MPNHHPATPKPLTKKFCNFCLGSNLQIFVANWKKYLCQFHWQRGFLALAMAVRLGLVGFDRSKLNAIANASDTCFRFCAIDSWISFLALAIASKKIIQNCQWNSCKVVAIWRSQWNSGFSTILISTLLQVVPIWRWLYLSTFPSL